MGISAGVAEPVAVALPVAFNPLAPSHLVEFFGDGARVELAQFLVVLPAAVLVAPPQAGGD